jgi:hypothetical protein
MDQHRFEFVPFMFLFTRGGTAGQRGPGIWVPSDEL